MEIPHLCHAVDCNERIPPARLMCPRHWYLVPHPLRKQVWKTYRPGQEIDKNPSWAYLQAAHAAINFVARAEGKPELKPPSELIKAVEESVKNHKSE